MKVHDATPATAMSHVHDTAPAGPLAHVGPREAGYYGLANMEGRIRHSPTLAKLRGALDDGLLKRQIAMLQDAGVLGIPANAYTQTDFFNLTRAALAHDVGNCGEMAFVAARAIAELGYPHPIEILTFVGEKGHADQLDHAVLRLNGATSGEAFWIDPFARRLRPDEQKRLTGAYYERGIDHPAAFDQTTATANLFCYVHHGTEGRVSLQRASEIAQVFDLSVTGKLTRTSSGTMRFQSTADLLCRPERRLAASYSICMGGVVAPGLNER
ncbi:hypothetical protein OVY01_13920 [Robbsia sp. Bb-Pol-6]|uniref:Uncharacterized protein n=1 Tax=Robbsia betulipollinis TaxID=2981849 RepID=A0ABT3ZP43_9BURK|nr:hypothetical protein [Robbsia betulipollinis]MCY0388314.1 hypothetical protein [Robbsia betulipollinis]